MMSARALVEARHPETRRGRVVAGEALAARRGARRPCTVTWWSVSGAAPVSARSAPARRGPGWCPTCPPRTSKPARARGPRGAAPALLDVLAPGAPRPSRGADRLARTPRVMRSTPSFSETRAARAACPRPAPARRCRRRCRTTRARRALEVDAVQRGQVDEPRLLLARDRRARSPIVRPTRSRKSSPLLASRIGRGGHGEDLVDPVRLGQAACTWRASPGPRFMAAAEQRAARACWRPAAPSPSRGPITWKAPDALTSTTTMWIELLPRSMAAIFMCP